MGRSPCCAKVGLNRGAWTAMEDKTLAEYITTHGEGKWRNLPKRAGLKRCGKSCRLRWLNYLRPDIKRGNISPEEEELIIRLHKLLGNRWSLIAGRLPGRTDNEIKNYWNTHIGKKVQDQQSSSSSHEANTTHRKPPTHQKTHHKNTNVIRTKASRCTKVFMPHQSTQTDNVTTNLHGASPFLNHDNYDPQPGYDLSIFLNYPENHVDEHVNSGDFLGEFKMDESFLSEFLNVDFSELYNYTNATAKEGDGARNDPNDLDFRSSMAPINDSELDWLS